MKAEVEVKVKRRSGSCFLILSFSLPIQLVGFFSILLGWSCIGAAQLRRLTRQGLALCHDRKRLEVTQRVTRWPVQLLSRLWLRGWFSDYCRSSYR